MIVHIREDGLKVVLLNKKISATFNLLEDQKTRKYIAVELSNHHGTPVTFGFKKPIANFTLALNHAEAIIKASHLCDIEEAKDGEVIPVKIGA